MKNLLLMASLLGVGCEYPQTSESETRPQSSPVVLALSHLDHSSQPLTELSNTTLAALESCLEESGDGALDECMRRAVGVQVENCELGFVNFKRGFLCDEVKK